MRSPRPESRHARYPNNLPLQLNSFIGRERELAGLRELIWSTRLLTLTGPGGCGKTRLALRLAEQLLDAFGDGVWFVDLAPLPETGPVAQVVAAVFAIHETAGRSFSAALIDYLRPREMLIVLDNCEHVLPACAELATTLLRACPNLYLLATSREALNVDGEVAWQTPPLSTLPPEAAVDAAALARFEAPRLFLDRAAAARPAFTPSSENAAAIARICHQLDGLPLAIELAAARVSALPVEQIATRLVDRFDLLNLGRRTAPARHQTLRAMIDWSYGLLAAEEKVLFRRLAAFAGGWTIQAAEAVCSDDGKNLLQDGDAFPTLDLLSRLVEKSLVVAEPSNGDVRYHFLETILEYAREKLAGEARPGAEATRRAEDARIRDRHLAYFAAWAQAAEPGLTGPEQSLWLERYELEHENIRAALDWGRAGEHQSEPGLRLAVGAARFFRLRGYLSEGRASLAAALEHAAPAGPSPLRALGLTWLANLAYIQSDYPAMHSLLQEGLSIWRELGLEHSAGYAGTLEMLGELKTEEGDYAAAQEIFTQSLAIYRAAEDALGICEVLMQLGWAAMRVGDYPQARARLEEFLSLSRATGYDHYIAFALSGLGELAVRQGDYEGARALLEESLALRRAHGDAWGIGTALGSLGWASLRQGDYPRMRAALRESIAVRMEIGDRSGSAWCLEKLAEGTALEARAQPSAARREGCLQATRIYAAAAAIRAPLGSVIDPADQPEHERNLAALLELLGPADFAQAWSDGEGLLARDPELAEILTLGLAEAAADPGPEPAGKPGGLSRREREVAALIVQGKSNREIAAALTVEIKTVEAHVNHIFNKLGFDSRVQIAVWAIEKGLARQPEA